MVRQRPELVADLLTGPPGIEVPAYQKALVSPGDLTDVAPTEYRADAVVTFYDGDQAVLAVVVEVQLRPDVMKRRTWPVYVATSTPASDAWCPCSSCAPTERWPTGAPPGFEPVSRAWF